MTTRSRRCAAISSAIRVWPSGEQQKGRIVAVTTASERKTWRYNAATSIRSLMLGPHSQMNTPVLFSIDDNSPCPWVNIPVDPLMGQFMPSK